MLLVALTRFSPPGAGLEAEVAALAPVFGMGAYELRLALAHPPPIVLASAELERAKELVLFLRGRGHGAIACDAASVLSSEALTTSREFRFEPESYKAGSRLTIIFSVLLLLLLAAGVYFECRNKRTQAGKA